MKHDNRRSFLKKLGIASVLSTSKINRVFAHAFSALATDDDYVPPKGNIRVPVTDGQWKRVKDYVDDPGLDYRHAYETAFEAFRDLKYGVRIADPKTASSEQSTAGTNSPIRFTQTKDGREVYAICIQWPGSELRLKTLRAKTGSKVRLLGVSEPLKWRNESDALAVQIPDAL